MRNLVVRLCPPTLASGSSGRRPSLFLAALLALAVSLSVLLAVPWPASGQQSDQEVPARPTGLTGTVSPEQVSLSWDDPGDSSITGYQVLRRNPAVDAKGVFQTVVDDTGGSGTSYVDTTVAAETRYFYRVLARNAAGLSPRSGLFRADVPPPDPDATRAGATDLGDVTSQEGVIHRDGSVNGASDRLDYFRFTLTAARTVELALRRQDANGDLYLEDGDGTGLSSSENEGNAKESIAESLGAGTYYVRVQARAVGNNNYRLRYEISPGPEQSTPENSAASGSPAITGTAQVHETLSADTAGIADANGLSNVEYAYRWVRTSGGVDTDIADATGATYTLVRGDLDHTVKVRVSFTDDDRYSETLNSAATATVVRPPNASPSGLPTITGTVQVGETLAADTSGISDGNGLTNVQFMHQWVRNDGSTDTNIPGATGSTYTLRDADLGNSIKVRVSFTDDDGYSETLTSDATDAANRPPNATATGQPAITGTVQVGETLSAETSGISDGNGLTNAQYAYQWVRNDGSTDTDISGATGSTFTLTSSDAGNAFKVKVTFTDDEGYSESLASNLTDTLLVAQQQSSSTPEPDDGDFPDEATTSGVVNVGDSVRGKINFIGDRDWFAVVLEGGRTYHVDQLGGWINHLTLLYGIYDQTGTFIDGTTDENRGGGSDSHVVFTPANDGTYFVAAGADESGDYSYFPIFIVASYRLSVIDATDGHPDDTHTADIETTGRISVDGRVDGDINYRSDRDWFAVTLESGIEYQIDILGWPTRDGSLLDPYLAGIYDSSGTVVANTANDNGGYERNSRLIYSATNSGTYFLGAGAQGNSKGTYILQVLDNTDDYPADISTTGALTLPGTTMGRIEHGGDRDWFAVPLQAGIDYAFDLDGRVGDMMTESWMIPNCMGSTIVPEFVSTALRMTMADITSTVACYSSRT